MQIIVTGGAGFIGSALIRFLIRNTEHKVINIDSLTYAGNIKALENIPNNKRYKFYHANICDRDKMAEIFDENDPDLIMHLAAESHVDRSIEGPLVFLETNIMGTATLLETARSWLARQSDIKQKSFKFQHISTDEVYGDLEDNAFFLETTPYQPSSPYSASKAASDHLVRAWHRTYKLPIIITNCSNNYGPHQFPEKLIPVIIKNALAGNSLPVYGNGLQVRDWLYVDDHVKALWIVAKSGVLGETYNIGGFNEKTNIEVVKTICTILDEIKPAKSKISYQELISYVKDRPGHDTRYAIDASKINTELGWYPEESFESGIRKTIEWYLDEWS